MMGLFYFFDAIKYFFKQINKKYDKEAWKNCPDFNRKK